MKFILEHCVSFPDELRVGTLYWSQEFEMSAHLCACGCGDTIFLPIDKLNFSITQGSNGPTLRPSVGNWGVCNAHYLITDGGVDWASQLSPEIIAASRAMEDARRDAYYNPPPAGFFTRLQAWIQSAYQHGKAFVAHLLGR